MHWILLLIAIACEACATAGLKLTEGFTRPLPVMGVFLGYALALFCFSLAIRTIPVGIAYALWSGIGMLFIVLIGWLCFGQKVDAAAIFGLACIFVGIAIIHLFSKSAIY